MFLGLSCHFLVAIYKPYVHECNFAELMAFESCSAQEANYPIWQAFTFVLAISLATVLPYGGNVIQRLEKIARANGQVPNMILGGCTTKFVGALSHKGSSPYSQDSINHTFKVPTRSHIATKITSPTITDS